MYYDTLIEQFKSALETTFDAYQFNSDASGFGFKQQDASRRLEFGGSFAEYGSYCVFRGWYADICFIELEKILAPILVKNHLLGDHVLKNYQATISIPIQKYIGHDVTQDNLGMEIRSASDVELLISSFQEFYKEHIVPFFEYWHALTPLMDFVLANPEPKVLMETIGLIFPFRRIALMKLTNYPEYKTTMEALYKGWKSDYEEDPEDLVSKQYYLIIDELRTVLNDLEYTSLSG